MNKGMFGFPERFRDESFHGFPKRRVGGESFFGFPSGSEDYDFKFNVTSATKTKVIVLNSDSGGITTVDWGDGSTTRYTMQPIGSSISHTYDRDGIYLVNIYGDTEKVSGLNFNNTNSIGIRNNFSKFPNIKDINIGNNGFNTSIPQIFNLYNLTTFNASFCAFSGNIPSFSNSPLLKVLSLAGNSLSGNIPDIGANINLETVFLNQNSNLTGNIPFMGNCLNLNTFHCHLCNLNGTLPDFSNCLLLSNFVVYNNQFTGTLPNFSNCSLLNNFQIHNNQFSGILSLFDNLTNLVTFNCSNNQFSGNIPSFSGCTSLQTLNGSSNEFSGILPIAPTSIVTYSFGQNRINALEVPTDVVSGCTNLVTFSTYRTLIGGSRTIPDFSTNTKLESININDGVTSGQFYNNGTLSFNTNVLKIAMFNYCNGISYDFTNLIAPSLVNTQFQSIGTNLDITFPLGTSLRSQVFYLQFNNLSQPNVDGTVNSAFVNRLNFNNTLAKQLIIHLGNAAPSGTYQQPTGFNHDLTEPQIDALSVSWSVKEKIWVLVNCQNSSVDTIKRYKWTITTN